MAIDPTSPRTRRAILTGALGAAAAVGIDAVARPVLAQAVDPAVTNVALGAGNSASTLTMIFNTAANGSAFAGYASGTGTGVYGESTSGVGVSGASSSYYGVFGGSTSGIGVYGSATSGEGMRGTSGDSNGVTGSSASSVASGVYGENTGGGYGTYGRSNSGTGTGAFGESSAGDGVHGTSTSGNGVFASSSSGYGIYAYSNVAVGIVAQTGTGYALQTLGRLNIDTSGIATIPAGATTKTITPSVDVTAGSFVLLTPMANIGTRALWFTRNVGSNTITIRLSSSRTSATTISWLLLG